MDEQTDEQMDGTNKKTIYPLAYLVCQGYNYFTINLNGSYLAELGFKLATPGSEERHITYRSTKPSCTMLKAIFMKELLVYSGF